MLKTELLQYNDKLGEHLQTADEKWQLLENHIRDEENTKLYLREKLEQNDQFHRDLRPLVEGIQGLSMFGKMISRVARVARPVAYLILLITSTIVVLGQWGQKAWMSLKVLMH